MVSVDIVVAKNNRYVKKRRVSEQALFLFSPSSSPAANSFARTHIIVSLIFFSRFLFSSKKVYCLPLLNISLKYALTAPIELLALKKTKG